MRKSILFLLAFLWTGLLTYSQNNQWTWMKGDSTIGNTNYGIYGTLGTAAVTNRPGSRYGAAEWTDASGNLWLYGGYGYVESGSYGFLNDLWKYNPSTNQWTWVKGDKATSVYGVYGTQGTAAAANKPGGRQFSATWADASGNLWLFGGEGYGESGSSGSFNDLWRYNIAANQWTWMKGDKTRSILGVYGTQGTAAAANKPGSRKNAMHWIDASGNFWLLGGNGFPETGTFSGHLNDLWRYTPGTNQWTWVKGDKILNVFGVYGTQGTAAAANKPGGRYGGVTWADGSGNLWLFGGYGYVDNVGVANLNDLWRYNIAANQWTWMKGDKTLNVAGVYGTQGTAAAANKPGARSEANSWIDASGNFWLFGGSGIPESGSNGPLNDLWKYTPGTNQWTWVKGDKIRYPIAVLGSQGVAAAANKPGGRYWASSWKDASGNLWILGGTGDFGRQNDMWKYNIATNQWTWVRDYVTIGYSGVYGTQGVGAAANKPGSRNYSMTWSDASGNLWLFGGTGIGSTLRGDLSDLWKYNIAANQWAWIKGDSAVNLAGVYGSIGVAAATNFPGGRNNAVTWKDAAGNLWLFGGGGYDESGLQGSLNDLWKYNPTTNQWAWINGDKLIDINGVYGVQGTAATGNKPGGRQGAVSWTDASGNLWLFGGTGYDEAGANGWLSDLWKYNPATNEWTWVKGDKTVNESGLYAGLPDQVRPGGRTDAICATDASGNMWLYGGYGNGIFNYGSLNDLWKYDPALNQWTLVNGWGYENQSPVFGTMGIMDIYNSPGGRSNSPAWIDQAGNFWLFSGYGGTGIGDLWRYDVVNNQWTWVKGDISSGLGVYGTQGVSALLNSPGYRGDPGSWTDASGNFWLFSGYGSPGNDLAIDILNDLWKFSPCSNAMSLSPAAGSFCDAVTTITLTATGGGAVFEWYKDGILIPGQTGVSFNATSAGNYYAKSTIGACPVFSQIVTLLPAMVTPSLGGNGIYCEAYFVNVGIPLTEEIQDYTWKQNGAAVYGPIGGNGGNQSLQFSMNSFGSGIYQVESSRPGCSSVYSNTVQVYFGGITNLTIGAIGLSSVSFNWLDYNNPIKRFQYAVTTSPTPPVSGTTTSVTSATVTSLLSCTNYYLHVRGATIPDFDIGQLTFCSNWTTIPFTTPGTGPITWTGNVSYDWHNPENWSCKQLPGPNSEVIINGGLSRYPIVYLDATVKKLTLNTGASINVQPGVVVTITGL